jgi:hypothetical protein
MLTLRRNTVVLGDVKGGLSIANFPTKPAASICRIRDKLQEAEVDHMRGTSSRGPVIIIML